MNGTVDLKVLPIEGRITSGVVGSVGVLAADETSEFGQNPCIII